MKRLSLYSLTLSAAVLLGLMAFQNCAPAGTSATRGSNGTIENSSFGGTTTDNPMSSNLKVAFVGLSGSTQLSLCISGSNITTLSASGGANNNGNGNGNGDVGNNNGDNNGNNDATSGNGNSNGNNDVGSGNGDNNGNGNSGLPELSPQMSSPLAIASLSATAFGQQSVTYGAYNAVVLTLSNGCGSGASLTLTNSQGTFSTAQTVQLVFSGTLNASSALSGIDLDISKTLQALNQVSSSAQISAALSSVTGQIDAQ